jgi:tripartite-type tricarboxylate transporter receptor subunit TctC
MLKILRAITSLATVFCAASTFSQTSDWPAAGKPIQLTVPSPGGGGSGDTIARMLAEQLAINL